MKAITLRLSERERSTLENVKALGFGSITEVIKCAALSLVDTHPKSPGRKKQSRTAIPA